MSKNILMICYYYPPLIDVGCKRSLAFSKYFKKYGWNPIVLSVKNPDKTYCLMGTDRPPEGIYTKYTYSIFNPNKLAGKLNGLYTKITSLFNVKLSRNYFYNLLCIPDIFWGWMPLATFDGLKIIRQKQVDLIYVSCPPFSSAIIGVILKMITGKTLIIDFRDSYALKPHLLRHSHATPRLREDIDLWFEAKILNRADLFVVTTEEMRNLYADRYKQNSHKIYAVHNGFEAGELPSTNRLGKKYSKFTIFYSGNYYFEAPGRYTFFESLALLKKQGRVNERLFQFIYYGAQIETFDQIAKRLEIEDLLVLKPLIPHKALLKIIPQCHLHLIRIMQPMISTKLFEAIALNIPVLAIIPHGEAERLLKSFCPSSYVITDSSPQKTAEAIFDAMKKYEREEIDDNRVTEFLRDFSRESLTVKFMRLVENTILTTKSPPPGTRFFQPF